MLSRLSYEKSNLEGEMNISKVLGPSVLSNATSATTSSFAFLPIT
jgi:hypothetical protein